MTTSHELATPASASDSAGSAAKSSEDNDFFASKTEPLATIATLAAGPDNLPWIGRIRDMITGPVPAGMRAERWDKLLEEMQEVSHVWGQRALDLGWTSLDLFGCNPDPFAHRVDRHGLATMLVDLRTPVTITSINSHCATLADRCGTAMRYFRPVGPGAVHLWEAYSMPRGP